MSRSQNKINAWKFFYPEGNGYAKKGYHLHHKDETLKHDNPERYEEWNIEDLVMITSTEHQHIHHIGCKHSDESKQKMSDTHKNMSDETRKRLSESHKNPSEEIRRKMSEAHKGIKLSEETKRKMSESRKGENNPFYGKHFSEESKLKLSESIKEHYKNNPDELIKMSERMKGTQYHLGHKHSEESKRKMSVAHRNISDETRRRMSESARNRKRKVSVDNSTNNE